MRIAMWTSWGGRCGIAAYTASLVAALAELGVEPEIVTVPYEDRDPGRRKADLERLNAAELVHLQHEYTFFGGIAPGRSTLPAYLAGLRVPHVITAHTVFTAAQLLRLPEETRSRQRIAKTLLAALPSYRQGVEREPFRRAAAVVCHTDAAREALARRRIPGERIHVIPAGAPEPRPAAPDEVAAFRERYGLGGKRVLGIFGYVTRDKGYEVALAALAKLPPAVHLLIAGGTRVEHEAPYLTSLRKQIEDLGLSSRVTITGYLEEDQVPAALAASDLVLAPHTAANGSYSVRVALAHGRAVLASDLACFRELHEAGAGVEVFDSEDEGALAERAAFLLASLTARRALEEQARAGSAAWTWREAARRTVEVYRSVLKR